MNSGRMGEYGSRTLARFNLVLSVSAGAQAAPPLRVRSLVSDGPHSGTDAIREAPVLSA